MGGLLQLGASAGRELVPGQRSNSSGLSFLNSTKKSLTSTSAKRSMRLLQPSTLPFPICKRICEPIWQPARSCASQVRQTNCSCGIATPSKAVAWYSGSRTHRASIAPWSGHVASSTTRICLSWWITIIMPTCSLAERHGCAVDPAPHGLFEVAIMGVRSRVADLHGTRPRSRGQVRGRSIQCSELDAVIFGHRMSDVDRNAIAEITRRQYPHAQLLQLI